jgi:hypothetical protein
MKELPRPLGPKVSLLKIPQNALLDVKLSHPESSWLTDLLKEMNEKASYAPVDILLKSTGLEVDLRLQKKSTNEYGLFLLIEGKIQALYATECVKTLRPMKEELSVEFAAACLDKEISESEEFADSGEFFWNQRMWEIYPTQNNNVDLFEILHEQIYLHYNMYPVADLKVSRGALEQDQSDKHDEEEI